jgi:tetratricopeptide (TPR) repeat protein
VYGRLSVFAGGFELDTAEHVCAGDGVEEDDIAELVWALVDASLVQADESAGETRYRMLRVVRSHAAHRAREGEAMEATRRLARLELAQLGPDRPLDVEWRSAMGAELDNVRQVVATLAESKDTGEQAIAQTLAWSIGRYHDSRDAFRAGIAEVARWAGLLTARTPERAALLSLLAELHLRLGEVDDAAVSLTDAVTLADETGLPTWDETSLERHRGEIALRRGDLDRAIEIGRAALSQASTPRAQSRLFNLLGIALAEQGDNAASADAVRLEIDAGRRARMDTILVNSYGNLAEVLLRSGDARGAAASQLDCLELSRSIGGVLQRAFSVVVAAHLAGGEAQWDRAVELQTAADLELDRVEWAPYGEDMERRRRLFDDARRELGDERFAAAAAAGASLTIDAAADIAAAELRRIAAKREEPV